MNNFTRKVLLVWAGIGIAALAVVFLSIAAAQAATNPVGQGMMGKVGLGRTMMPGIFGKVTAVSGTTITVLGGRPSGTQTIYTVNAANAVVIKNATTSSVGSIVVGDAVLVQGTVSVTSVTATRILDGTPLVRGKFMMGGRGNEATGTLDFENGTSSRAGEGRGMMRPSGTPPFASGTFPGDNHGSGRFGTSTATGTPEQSAGQAHMGFFGSIGNFFGHMFGGFKF